MPLAPSETEDTQSGESPHLPLQSSRAEWRVTGNRITQTRGPSYPLSIVSAAHISQQQEQEHPVSNIPHVIFLTEIFCLLWSKGRELLPKTYTHRWRKKGNVGGEAELL